MGGGMSSRLFQEVRRTGASATRSSPSRRLRGHGPFDDLCRHLGRGHRGARGPHRWTRSSVRRTT
jgi:hypothetical protein